MTDLVSTKMIPMLAKALKKIHDDRREKLDKLGQEFGDPYRLANRYVRPSGQAHNPADEDEYEDAPVDIREPVLQIIHRFLTNDPKHGGGRNSMLVLADAGMGKTSLLLMLKMTHMLQFWPSDVSCELLKLGPDSLVRIEEITNPASTVLLLDSLDEDPEAWTNVYGRLISLLSHTTNFRRVIISCRTQFFPEGKEDPFKRQGVFTYGGHSCKAVYLSPFSDEQVNEYLDRRFPSRFFGLASNPMRHKAQHLAESMESLRMRPFLLDHIDDLMDSGSTSQANLSTFDIYDSLVLAWLNREEARLNHYATQQGIALSDVPSSEDLRDSCRELALKMQSQDTRWMSIRELESCFADPRIGTKLLEHGSKSLLNKDSDSKFRFSHFSVQEFMVADAILSRVWKSEEIHVTDQTVTFLADQEISLSEEQIEQSDWIWHVAFQGRTTIGEVRFPLKHSISIPEKEPHYRVRLSLTDLLQPKNFQKFIALANQAELNLTSSGQHETARVQLLIDHHQELLAPITGWLELKLGGPVELTLTRRHTFDLDLIAMHRGPTKKAAEIRWQPPEKRQQPFENSGIAAWDHIKTERNRS